MPADPHPIALDPPACVPAHTPADDLPPTRVVVSPPEPADAPTGETAVGIVARAAAAPSDWAGRIERALARMPAVGQTAFGFRLERVLGRGAFGRVYLATQPDLAGRFVAIKVSVDLAGESRTLALLQHTNIVPVYSVHRADGLQAVCMPYFGAATLAGLLHRYRDRKQLPATGRELVTTLRGLTGTGAAGRPGEAAEPPAAADAALARLSAVSYERAVCWIAARLADGLQHAHDRGVLHRDVKPANILIGDDGQPMLLDFGIAEMMAGRADGPLATVGGTLPYMAPEALDEVRTGRAGADGRADVYALGLVLYELLTGRAAFRPPADTTAVELARAVAERRQPPPGVRAFNPAVTPGLESVVRTCLAGDPARRYATAGDLRDDLDRYLADQPLAVAPERSYRERARKWAARHPRLSSTASLTAAALVVLAAGGVAASAHFARVARLEADETRRAFAAASAEAQYLLFERMDDAPAMAAGVAKGRAALAAYGLPDAADWDRRPAFTALPAEEQSRLRDDIVETCLLVARGSFALAADDPDAARFNALAETAAGGRVPRRVYAQQATLARAAGRAADAAAAAAKAAAAPPVSARDFYAAACDEKDAGRPAAAAPLFRKAQALDPKMYWAYVGEGVCLLDLNRPAEARGGFTAAVALDPQLAGGHYNRGVANFRAGDPAAAAADFSEAVRLQPGFADAYLARAAVRVGAKDFAAATDDLDAAQENGASLARTAPLRARIRTDSGLADPNEDPTDEAGWVHRGIAHLEKNPAAALAAFEKAVALAPNSVPARMYKAHVLGETGREAECARELDKVLELDAENVPARAARGVMLARLEKWDAALADGRTAMAKLAAPFTLYQVAGIFARASKHDPEYAAEAVTLVGIALRAGVGFDYLATDKDLDAVRDSAAFKRVVAHAERFRPRPAK